MVRDGLAKAETRRLSTFVRVCNRSSLMLARVESGGEPIEDVVKSLAVVLRRIRRPGGWRQVEKEITP